MKLESISGKKISAVFNPGRVRSPRMQLAASEETGSEIYRRLQTQATGFALDHT